MFPSPSNYYEIAAAIPPPHNLISLLIACTSEKLQGKLHVDIPLFNFKFIDVSNV
jgi:hypothetical protein